MSRRMVGEHDAAPPAAKDSEPSSYFSLREQLPATGRSHSGSMDVTDVSYAPRLGSDLRGGEALPEEEPLADYNPDDDSTSDEGSPHPRQSLDQHHQQQLMMDNGDGDGGMDMLNNDGIDPNMAESGALGPGIPLGGGLEEDGAAEDEEIVRGEAAGGIGLEPLELPPPADGPGGSGSGDGVGESPKSSPLGQGPGLEAITLEAAETEKASKASPALAGVSGGTSVGGGGGVGVGAVDSRGPSSGGHKTWLEGSSARDCSGSGGVGGSGGMDGDVGMSGGAGSDKQGGPTVREMRCSSAASSSSDETMAGNARLSAPAMKQQWEEAMSGANTPETPHRSRRGSTSMDGSVGRGGVGVNLFSPGAARGLASSFGPVDGVVNRSGRAGSVNGVGSGSFNTSGGGGGGGGSGVGIGVGASVLGSHLRTYGWVKDEEVSECMNACGTEFSALERRHHCRCCGAIFCENCSRHRCLVPEPVAPPGKDPLDPTRPHRVCNACYADVQASQEELLSTVSKARRHNDFNTDSAARHCNPPFGLDLAHEVRKSANTLNNVLIRRQGCDCDCDSLTAMVGPEQRVSHALWRGARGLVFVTVVKAGFLYAAEAGTGLCVARQADGTWSAPTAVQTFGLSWGLQAGCEVVDVVIPLRSDAAVEMLKCGGQVYVKLDAAVAVGPMGRSVGSAVGGRSMPGEVPALDLAARYSMSKGLFAGFGVGAGFLRVADRVNERFYGAQVSPRTLLGGAMPRPPAANPLYSSLARLEQITGRQQMDKRA